MFSRTTAKTTTKKIITTARILTSQSSPYFPFPSSPTFNFRPFSRRTMSTAAMTKRLEGKTILITGASSGIGRSCAFEFARTAPKNLKLVLTARRADRLREIAAQIRAEVGEGVQVLPVELDVADPAQVRGFVGALPQEFRDVDVLVNNA
jgi:shikimate 5-dehydrogenase